MYCIASSGTSDQLRTAVLSWLSTNNLHSPGLEKNFIVLLGWATNDYECGKSSTACWDVFDSDGVWAGGLRFQRRSYGYDVYYTASGCGRNRPFGHRNNWLNRLKRWFRDLF